MTMQDSDAQRACAICGLTFSQKSYLKVHLRRHEGVKPHKCKFCGRSFATKVDMARHVLKYILERNLTNATCAVRGLHSKTA